MTPVKQLDRLGELTTSLVQRNRATAYFELALCKGLSGGSAVAAASKAEQRRAPELELIKRAAVGAGSTDGMAAAQTLADAFLESVRQQSVLGRMTGVRRAPLNIRLPSATAVPTAYWHAEGLGEPIVKFTTGTVVMAITSLDVIVAFSKELIVLGGSAARRLAEVEMTTAIVLGENAALLDGGAAIAGQRPASILFGKSAVSGGSPHDLELDLRTLWAAVAGGHPRAPYFVTGSNSAMYLATVRNANGVRVFPDATAVGGLITGIPVIPSDAAEKKLVLVDADALLVADEGVVLDESGQTAIEMVDAPPLQQNGKTGTGTSSLVSCFQAGVIALRAQRLLNWVAGRSDGAAFINLPA